MDWYLPSRTEDGYGLSAATVERLAERGTRLLLTADCAITAVEEVALARAAGMDVVVTDHHSPRADGSLPDAPIVHPSVCGYPCPDLCAAGVAHKFAAALLAGAGRDPAGADEDLDLVALATVADCVPLRDENRRLVREGLHALATSRKPGIRALLRVAKVDPGALDARAIGFRLAPRINAAGRLYRADAGLELVLTDDAERAAAIADELDHANAERRHTETRILFEAEAQVRELGEQPAYVLAGEGWHPGVIGIVASRIAERHHRPCVMIALDGDRGDRLGALDPRLRPARRPRRQRRAPAAPRRAPRRGRLHDRARARSTPSASAFVAHAAAVLRPEDLVPTERVDAVVAGDELGLALAEELERLAPFGIGNPSVSLLVPAARLVDARPMGEEGRHVRFTVEAGGHRARAVAFGVSRLPDGDAHDATFTLELNEWNGAVEPRLVLRHAQSPAPAAVVLAGEPEDPVAAALAELAAPLPVGRRDVARRRRPARPPRRRPRRHAGRARRLGRARARGLRRRAPPPRAPRGPPRRLRRRGVARARARPRARRALRARRRARPAGRRHPGRADRRALHRGLGRRPRPQYALARPRGRLRPAPGGRRRLPRPARRRAARRGRRRTVARRRGPRPARARPSSASCASTASAATLPPARRTELDTSAAFRAYTTRLAEGRARLAGPRRAARAA